jgi:hypothetical protein
MSESKPRIGLAGRVGLCVVALAVVWAAAVAARAQSQDQDAGIRLAGIDLRLGMRQEDALRDLSAVYSVIFDESYNRWDVWAKDRASKQIGTLSFRSGRLAAVSKEWFEFGETSATSHGMAVSNAVRAVVGESRTCTVSVEERRQISPPPVTPALPTMGYWTTIACGRRKVMMYSSVDSREVSRVLEVLE